ncbi:hypothetical protein F3N42_14430 [Marinihelvus fidelis]|uniref:Beta/gamma crystallin 'Greek key' domain-containing protein n=1 Tax=Marinihelvus fidelis TaxID=2613842 RepID=A0A5N0T3T9_9GAMM|nr:hypothetical protein [Marinihelvus fidelis]KAA9129730.1 hypothetical protein F3N42_14430 [Marinihelvus fidelis]
MAPKCTLPFAVVLAATFSATTMANSYLNDLVGDRASGAEQELEDRGFEHHKTIKIKDTAMGYWWNDRDEQCVVVSVEDGRVKSIFDQPESMCGGSSSSSSHHSSSSHGSSRYFNVDSVEGMRASSGERELEDNGWEFVNSSRDGSRIWSNWWNDRERECVTIVTLNGRYDSVTDTLPYDCERDSSSHGSHGSSHGGRGDGVTLYRDKDYHGESLTLYRDESHLGDTRLGDDELSSIRVPYNCRVTLYTDSRFRGRSEDLSSDQSNMRNSRIGNDSASSIEVDCD